MVCLSKCVQATLNKLLNNGSFNYTKTSCLTFSILHPMNSHSKLYNLCVISWSNTPNLSSCINNLAIIKNKFSSHMPNWLNFDPSLCNCVKEGSQSYLVGFSQVFRNLFPLMQTKWKYSKFTFLQYFHLCFFHYIQKFSLAF